MRLFLNLKLLFLVIFLNTNLYSKDLTKVTIQLSWFDQFQFAGYYMAKEQGFYKDAGLDVEIPPFSLVSTIPTSLFVIESTLIPIIWSFFISATPSILAPPSY